MTEKPDTSINYAVQYQDSSSEGDSWYSMSGRNWNERRFRHTTEDTGMDETSSLDEAMEIAEALVQGRSHPCDPRSRYYREVLRSRVVIRVVTGHVGAVYVRPVKGDKAR